LLLTLFFETMTMNIVFLLSQEFKSIARRTMMIIFETKTKRHTGMFVFRVLTNDFVL